MVDENNSYTKMQKKYYDEEAPRWSINNLDPVVGSFIAHNDWKDYKYLFINIDNKKDLTVLDFGCGPGRNLVKYSDYFKQIDGVDLSNINLENAKIWIKHNNKNIDNFKLYLCNGINLNNISNNMYDIVMSTICLQHICVYEIRYNYFKEFFRILKPNGYITIQMGFGKNSPLTVGYYENYYQADATNRACDVCISDVSHLQNDLISIGFINFEHYILPVGPGDFHPYWIFFNAQKPE